MTEVRMNIRELQKLSEADARELATEITTRKLDLAVELLHPDVRGEKFSDAGRTRDCPLCNGSGKFMAAPGTYRRCPDCNGCGGVTVVDLSGLRGLEEDRKMLAKIRGG